MHNIVYCSKNTMHTRFKMAVSCAGEGRDCDGVGRQWPLVACGPSLHSVGRVYGKLCDVTSKYFNWLLVRGLIIASNLSQTQAMCPAQCQA